MPKKILLVLGMLLAGPVSSQEVWLATYGPGAEVWERFGHNALWLRDEQRGLDHTFSFGYFELDRPGFYRDFARGHMLYFGAASHVEREFEFYRQRDRSITVQRLDLSPAQFNALEQRLNEAIFPPPQYYEYDYFYANCSTWLRDLIDEVVDGDLRRASEERVAEMNLRDHVRRLLWPALHLYVGIHGALGPAVDREISAWDEMFLPDVLAREVAALGLVTETVKVHESTRFSMAAHPPVTTPWLLLAGLFLAALMMVPALKRKPGRVALWTLKAWALAIATAGACLLFLWCCSGHQAAWANANLLLFNPLVLVLWMSARRSLARAGAMLIILGLLAALAMALWPGGQWNLDLVALMLPVQMAALWLWRCMP